MLGPKTKLLPEDRRHEGNSLVRVFNIRHIDRAIVTKCFVIYLLFSSDVSVQHCVARPPSMFLDRSTLQCVRTLELLDFLLYRTI